MDAKNNVIALVIILALYAFGLPYWLAIIGGAVFLIASSVPKTVDPEDLKRDLEEKAKQKER